MGVLFERLVQWAQKNPWQAAGLCGGFVLGLLIVVIGFWETFFVFIVTAGGYLFGRSRDRGEGFSAVLNNLRRNRDDGGD
jgi:uncharacterized membrane protein